MNMLTVIEQVGILGITMLIGYIVVKIGYVNADVKDSISKIIVKVVLPCLIISSVSSKELEPGLVGDIFTVILMTLFCIAVLFAMGVATAKILKIPGETGTVHKLLSSLGNVIFMGYPVIYAVYGEQGFFYAIIYWLLNDMFLWTVGVLMLTKKDGGKRESVAKKLLNTNTVSFVVAILMFVFKLRLPSVIHSAVSGIGNLTTSLSMIFIGMALATVDIKNALKKWWIFIITPLKLIVMPIVFIFIFKLTGVNEVILGAVVLEAAMPAQTVLSILAHEHKCDHEYAAVGMLITTVASIVTLPFVCYMLQILV